MKFRNAWGLGLIFVVMASLIYFGCVRIEIDSPIIPQALPYSEQTIVEKEISFRRFQNPNRPEASIKYDFSRAQGVISYAQDVVDCGEYNQFDDHCKKFKDLENDFACKIKFVSKGSSSVVLTQQIPPFSIGLEGIVGGNPVSDFDKLNCLKDGVICSQFDLDKVWGANPSDGVKIVNDILFCENTLGKWGGCSQIGGSSIAIVKLQDADIETNGVLLLHEMGHNSGLYDIEHPRGINKSFKAVMNPGISHDTTKLNGRECFIMREGYSLN